MNRIKLSVRIGLLVSLILGIWVGPSLMPSTPTVAFTNPTADSEVLLNNFEDFDLWLWEPDRVTVQETTEHCTEGRGCAKVSFFSGENVGPGIELSSVNLPIKDWSGFSMLGLDVYNPQEEHLLPQVCLIDADDSLTWIWLTLAPGMNHLEVDVQALKFITPVKQFGPAEFRVVEGDSFDIANIKSVIFFFNPPVPVMYGAASQPNGPVLYFDNLRLLSHPAEPPLGKNLVENSSFETAPYDGWQGTMMLAGRAFSGFFQPEIDRSTAFDREASLKLAYPQTEFFQIALQIPNAPVNSFPRNVIGVTSKGVRVEPGKTYTLSLYLKAERPGVRVYFDTSDARYTGFGKEVVVDTAWQRYSTSGTFTEDSLYGNSVSINVRIHDATDSAIWVDAVQLEEGDLTDYQPTAPVEIGLLSEKENNLFQPGEPVVIKAALFKEQDGQAALTLEYQVVDAYRHLDIVKDTFSFQLPGQGRFVEEIPLSLPTQRGAYKLITRLRDAQGQLVEQEELAFGIIPPRARATPIAEDSPFGNHIYWISDNMSRKLELAQRIGVQWLRWFSPAKWYAVEPEDNHFFWPFDELIDQAIEEHHIEILPILGYAMVPPSLSHNPKYPEWASSGMRTQGDSGAGMLPEIEAWKDYVRNAVSHHKGKIRYWEVLNEPNVIMQAADYLPLLQAAYQAAKQVNPNVQIIAPAPAVARDPFLRELLELGGGSYIDIISVHLYDGQNGAPEVSMYGRSVEEQVRGVKALIDQYAPGRSLWVTELGWWTRSAYDKIYYGQSISDDRTRALRDPRLQADYLVRSFLIQLANEVEKFFYFLLDHYAFQIGADMSLTNYDLSPQPALLAYDAMTSILEGAEFKQEISLGSHIHCYLFEKEGKPIITLWTWGFDKTVTVPLPADKVQVLDIMGNPMGVETRGSSFELTISGSPMYIEGIDLTAEGMAPAFEQARVSEVPQR